MSPLDPINEAADKAFDAIDFLRSIWNLALNYNYLSRLLSSGTRPINRIRLGPIHTLHHPTGKPAAQIYWYDPFYVAGEAERINDDEWKRIDRTARVIRKRLAKLPYASAMRDVLIRYVRALDTSDFEKAFLKLWQILEVLTDTSTSQGYNLTIKRALFIWKDDEMVKAVLEHLRTCPFICLSGRHSRALPPPANTSISRATLI